MKIFGNGRVWNPSRHEVAWEFSKPASRDELGVFETDDKELIALALSNGFRHEESRVVEIVESEVQPDPVGEQPSVSEDSAAEAPVVAVVKSGPGRPRK